MKDPRAFDRARTQIRHKTAHLDEPAVAEEVAKIVAEVRSSQPPVVLLLGVTSGTSALTGHSEVSSTLSFSSGG